MSRELVVEAVESCGVPCAFVAWPERGAPSLPWAVFLPERDRALMADGKRWCGATRWRLELYQEQSDAELEDSLGDAIQEAFGPWTREDSWRDEEDVLVTSFRFTDIERSHEDG